MHVHDLDPLAGDAVTDAGHAGGAHGERGVGGVGVRDQRRGGLAGRQRGGRADRAGTLGDLRVGGAERGVAAGYGRLGAGGGDRGHVALHVEPGGGAVRAVGAQVGADGAILADARLALPGRYQSTVDQAESGVVVGDVVDGRGFGGVARFAEYRADVPRCRDTGDEQHGDDAEDEAAAGAWDAQGFLPRGFARAGPEMNGGRPTPSRTGGHADRYRTGGWDRPA